MLFCTSWIDLRKHCWIVSADAPRIQSHSPKKPETLVKKYQKTSEHENWKNETFVAEVSLKVWTISAWSTWLKKTFHLEKLPSCSFTQVFCTFEIGAIYFISNCEKHLFGFREKSYLFEWKKTRTFFLHKLNSLSKTLPKRSWSTPESFVLTVQKKNVVIWEKKYRNVLWTWKKKNWDVCRSSFALSRKVFHSKYRK